MKKCKTCGWWYDGTVGDGEQLASACLKREPDADGELVHTYADDTCAEWRRKLTLVT